MKRTRTLLAASLLAGTAAHAAYAGTVDVQFIKPEKFVDAGTSQWDEKDNIRLVGAYLQSLGERWLPPGQSMKIEVLDLDLAGNVQMSRRDATLVRVIKGRTDYPRITLRYTLADASGKVLRSGEEAVVDLDFIHGLPHGRDFSGLYYEKLMLQKWFRQRFVEQQAAN